MNGITVIKKDIFVRRQSMPVTVVSRPQSIRVNSQASVNVQTARRNIIVNKQNHPVTILTRQNIIKVTAQVPVLHKQIFKAFFLVAAAGQSIFTLPSFCVANGMLFLAINGTGQSPIRGDFSVLGNQLTLGAPLDQGDEVFGTYEEV